jgi:hypothetical protein
VRKSWFPVAEQSEKNTRQTSEKAASAASDVLPDDNASSEDKQAAGSALSQASSKPKSDD